MRWGWPWCRRFPADRGGASAPAAAADIEHARRLRGEAEQRARQSEREWPRIDRAMSRYREIHAENHIADAVSRLFRGT